MLLHIRLDFYSAVCKDLILGIPVGNSGSVERSHLDKTLGKFCLVEINGADMMPYTVGVICN